MKSLLGIFSKSVSKLFSLSKWHVIEPFKSYMEETISRQVDPLLTGRVIQPVRTVVSLPAELVEWSSS